MAAGMAHLPKRKSDWSKTKKGSTMKPQVRTTVHFMDGTKLALRNSPDEEDTPTSIMVKVRQGLEADKLVAEVDGSLLVIPSANVKYIKISPCPKELPRGILRGAHEAS